MIKYCLNYYEDFVEECNNRRIICVGLDNTFDEKKRKTLFGFNSKIDYWVAFEGGFSHSIIENYASVIISFRELKTLNLDEYVFLIVTDYVDYAKKKLKECVCHDVNVNCYTCKFVYRDYYDEKVLKSKRLDDVAMHWYEYYLSYILESNQKEQLLTERKNLLIQNDIRVIPRLVVVLTTRCNLFCENCIALTTHYSKQYDVPADIIIKSIEKISEVIDECTCVELIGGEPFLYKDLMRIICYLKNNSKVKFIQITTNGMIFNYDNEYKALLQGNVIVRVSDYSISNNAQKFVSWLKNNNISYMVQKDLVWTAIGSIRNKNKKSQEIKDEYNLCFEGLNCKSLLKGVIYDCTFSSRICDLGYADQCQVIDVLKEELTWDRLLSYWVRNESNACHYCNLMNPNAELVICAVQKKR